MEVRYPLKSNKSSKTATQQSFLIGLMKGDCFAGPHTIRFQIVTGSNLQQGIIITIGERRNDFFKFAASAIGMLTARTIQFQDERQMRPLPLN